ncbi:MAG: dihydrofolate reductase family protein [Solirubrobacterales bacterium]
MMPRVIVHIETSLDGCIEGFRLDEVMYYELAAHFKADMVLVGADTLLDAAGDAGPEEPDDYFKPTGKPEWAPYWVVPDSRGRVKNLHLFRRFNFCRDVIVLVSETTPKEHLEYLSERDYDYIIAGKDHVDYIDTFAILNERYETRTIRVDSGGTLAACLIKDKLVTDISILLAPAVAGRPDRTAFRSLQLDKVGPLDLELMHVEKMPRGFVWLHYKVED